jgi:hypothetical protein
MRLARWLTVARYFLLFEVLRRLKRGDAFWVPPRAAWPYKRLAAIYRTKRERAIGTLVDEFNAEIDHLRREQRARHNLAIDFDPRFRQN